MKYVKTFEQLSYKEGYDFNKSLNDNFKSEFFKSFTKGTELIFMDRQGKYDVYLFDMKFDEDKYVLLFKTESNQIIKINHPYYIEPTDLDKISLLPLTISPESKNLLEKMYEIKKGE